MNLRTFLDRIRRNPLDDTKLPYGWLDEELTDFLNDGIDEACEEIPLITDTSTQEICEIIVGYRSSDFGQGTNAATIKLERALEFYIRKIKYTIPAQDNISMNSCVAQAVSTYCKYLISVNASLAVRITKGVNAATSNAAAVPNLPSGYAPLGVLLVQTDASHTFTSGTNSLDDIGITSSFLTAPTYLTIDQRIVRVLFAKLSGDTEDLTIKQAIWFKAQYPDWENDADSTPTHLVEKLTKGTIVLYPFPLWPDRIVMNVQRRPLVALSTSRTTESPEIPEQHHRRLVNYVAAKAYGKQDAVFFDPEKEKKHLALWEKDKEEMKRSEIRAYGREEMYAPHPGML